MTSLVDLNDTAHQHAVDIARLDQRLEQLERNTGRAFSYMHYGSDEVSLELHVGGLEFAAAEREATRAAAAELEAKRAAAPWWRKLLLRFTA